MSSRRPGAREHIANLPFVKTVDQMLLEGVSCPDVAKFIQDDQGALDDFSADTLAEALRDRRDELRKAAGPPAESERRWFDRDTPEEQDDEDNLGAQARKGAKVFTLHQGGGRKGKGDSGGSKIPSNENYERPLPSSFARNLYKKLGKGIEELVESEALYLSQRARIDRLSDIEYESNGYLESLNRDYGKALDILRARVDIKEKLGLFDGDEKFRETLDIKSYSDKTAEVLNKPESRRRIVSLLERISKMGSGGETTPDGDKRKTG